MAAWQTENSGDADLDLVTDEETRDALQSQISADEEKQAGFPFLNLEGRSHLPRNFGVRGSTRDIGNESSGDLGLSIQPCEGMSTQLWLSPGGGCAAD